MGKRGLLSIALLVSIAVLGLLGVRLMTTPSHRIRPENIDRIRAGMTRQEVQELLGAPPGFRARGKVASPITYSGPGASWRDGVEEWWTGDEAAVLVFFDAQGRALHHMPLAVYPDGNSLLERLRRWLTPP